ncbi:hypothetical protein BC828DRAFT_254511 [Blastocladiella britannica]|nr:hypothetical protein BC828DRAFT_254511 [Blastocladiella britannica]
MFNPINAASLKHPSIAIISSSLQGVDQPTAKGPENVNAGDRRSNSGKAHELKDLFPVSRVEKSVFQVAFISTHDNEVPSRISWLFTFLEDIQWFSFAYEMSLHDDMPLVAAAIPEPLKLLSDYTAFAAANAIALVILFFTISLIALIVVLMHRQAKVPIWSLRMLRLLCSLLFSVLSLPFLTLFIGGIACIGPNGSLGEYAVSCTSGTQLPLLVLNVVGLALFIPLLLVGSLVFIETSPVAESPLAKAHGRVDFRGVICRVVFAFVSIFTREQSTALVWVYMSIVAVGLAYITSCMIQLQPYYHTSMTAFRAVCV